MIRYKFRQATHPAGIGVAAGSFCLSNFIEAEEAAEVTEGVLKRLLPVHSFRRRLSTHFGAEKPMQASVISNRWFFSVDREAGIGKADAIHGSRVGGLRHPCHIQRHRVLDVDCVHATSGMGSK